MTNSEYNKIESYNELMERINNKVAFEGVISEIPWQHMIKYEDPYNNINYVDIKSKEGKKPIQIVVYTKTEAPGSGSKINFSGTVRKITGKSKRPGSDQVVTEIQVDADDFEVIEAKKGSGLELF
jgi:hypothetical protein